MAPSNVSLSSPPLPPPTATDANTVLEGLIQSFSLIIISEIGDKTFFIAAILAMRHARLIVFFGAFASLLLMSCLSAEMGHFLPKLVPKRYTQFSAAVLFVVFGTKMWVEARGMKGGAEKMREEMKEAEEEIEDDEAGSDGQLEEAGFPFEQMEKGQSPQCSAFLGGTGSKKREVNKEAEVPLPSSADPTPPISRAGSKKPRSFKATCSAWADGARNFCSLFFGPVFVQAFVLTFLGEWGDRSQITTIALGAAHNVYVVALGTIIAHSCCTALAVTGGRYVATKISVKHVTYTGSILFLMFGFIYFYEALYVDPDEVDISIPIGANEAP